MSDLSPSSFAGLLSADHLFLLFALWLCFWGLILFLGTRGTRGRAHRDCQRCALRDSFRADQGYGL